MWQSGKMKKLRRILAGWLCVILVVSLNISSLAEKGGQITEIIPTLSSEDKAETDAPSEESDELPDETETMPIETDPAGEPEEENKNTSSVILHTPSNTENTEQAGESDTSDDPEDEATPSDADEDLINDLFDDEATPSDATPADADLVWSVEDLQKRIDALPAVNELEGEELGDFLLEVYREVVDIREVVESLSEDEQALLDVEKLEELETFFVEEYPAVFATEAGVLVDTGIMNKTLRWSVYETSEPGAKDKDYALMFTWTGDQRTGTINGTDSGSNPNYLKKYSSNITAVTFPSDGEITLGSLALINLRLTEIVFPDSVTRIWGGALDQSYAIQKITLSGSTAVNGKSGLYKGIVGYSSDINQLVFTDGNEEREGSITNNAFQFSDIKELSFPATLKTIGTEAFANNIFLEKLNLGSVRSIGQRAFQNNSTLRNLLIPNTVEEIGSKAFAGCNVKRLEFRAVTDENVAEDAIELIENGVLMIGKETKRLTGSLLKNLKNITILFEGDNVIEISGMPESFFLEQLAGLNGTYHVDSQGVLYSQDDKTLIYCPPGIETYVVPSTVETVSNYAFSQAKDLTEIVFNAPQNISQMGERAFYNCRKLYRINEKTTVADATGLFTGCHTLGKQIFLNTALIDAPQTGGILQTEKIVLSRNEGDGRLEFGFANGMTTTVSENSFENLTGDTIRLVVNADGPNTKKYQYRIYLETSNSNCSFGMKVDETLNLGTEGGTTPVTLRESDVEGIYYLEFPLAEGSTVSFDITPVYPSPTSSGGALTIWGVILTDEEAKTAGKGLEGNDGTNFAQMTEWKTKPSAFLLEKRPDTSMRNGLVLRGDGTADGELHVATNGGDDVVSYYLDFKLKEGDGSQDKPYGKDYVQKIRCEDKLELPPGMHWQPEILQAIQTGRYYAAKDSYSGSSSSVYYYAEIEGGVKQIARLQYRTPYKDTAAYDMKVVNNTVILCWDLLNASPDQQEIGASSVFLSINSECLRIAQGDGEYDWDTDQTLTNHVEYQVQYTYSGKATVNAESALSIATPQSNITLTKETSMSKYVTSYRGEDVNFTVTLKNEGAVAHNGLIRLEDTTLPKDFYIKPENIERIFREQPMGQRMELTIAPVYLYETLDLGTAVSIDGTATVPVTPGNSSGGDLKSKNGKLVFAWEGSELKLNVYYDNQAGAEKKEQYSIDLIPSSESVQRALDQAGYVVTYDAEYDMVWNLENMPLYGGQVLEIKLYTTLKDTFQYLQHSLRHEGDFSSKREANQAKVVYKEGGVEKSIRASDEGEGLLGRDFRIDKSFAVNGIAGESDTIVSVGDLVDYTLSLKHSGVGDTNNLPLIDYMTGPQQLLVPAALNQNADWIAGVELEEIDGTAYYILSESGGTGGEYKNVWVGADEHGTPLCADSVKLTREYGVLTTTITWYFHNLESDSYVRTVTYKVRMKITDSDKPIEGAGSVYLLNNEVWVNGRLADYLYDFVGMYITEFLFGKEIVVSPDGVSPEELVKHSIVKKGSRVKYKLNLDLYSNITNSITVTDAMDVLPPTYELFEWNQDNVEVSYVDGQGNSIEEHFAWHIEKTDASGQISENEAENIYYTIRWDKLVIPVGNLAIYITLDFPKETVLWDSFAAANDGNLIYNKFYIGMVEKSVSHELAYEGRVYLQKGVYRIGHYFNQRFISTNTHTHYINEDGNDPSIVYYVQLYNGGKSRLYLTEIQDQLPKGFTLQDGRLQFGYMFTRNDDVDHGYNQGQDYVYTGYAQSRYEKEDLVSSLYDGGKSIVYKTAKVSVRATNDTLAETQKLTFTFSEGNKTAEKNVSYDPEQGLYYLNQGEAIAFAYACDTGSSEETEDYAENKIAMPYLDYSGGGVDAAQGVIGAAQGDNLNQNVGLCGTMDQTEAQLEGFFIQDSDENQKWLCSDVTVERGAIIPGIVKTAETYTNESGVDIPYTNGAGQNDTINWKLNLFNNGQVPMADYTVKDIMEFPYTFTGDVKYTSYDSGNKMWLMPAKGGILFTMNERRIDPVTGETIILIGEEEIPVAESEATAEWKELLRQFVDRDELVSVFGIVRLRFYKEDGREVMEIRLEGLPAQILAGARAELEFSTKNTTLDRPYRIYTNTAVMTPTQIYKEDFVTQGMNVIDETGKNAGVKNSAPVVISGAYATSSLKSVEEADTVSGESNKTDSSQVVNYILLPDKGKELIYTLTVNNDNQNLYSIGNLIFIDNLPEPGDHATFSEDSERGSKFKISLAENPNVTVQIESKDGTLTVLSHESYKVDYTEKTMFENTDWKGGGTGWTDTHSTASRSLRVQILPTTDELLIPEGSKVHVTFHAQVDGSADAGDIAWNSFGYFYSMIGETAELLSAPAKVGVKIPEVPILEKRLISVTSEPFTAKTDQTFHFLIHQGPVLDGLDYNNEDAVKTALSGDSTPAFTVVPVTVKSGDTSGQAVLSGLKQWKAQTQPDGTIEWVEDTATDWNWTDRTQYTIAELTPSADYQFFRLHGSTTNGVSFYHQDATPIRLDCENRYPGWSMLLKKADSKIETTLLPGAVFALYSPLASDQIQEGDAAYDAYLALGESERPVMTFAEPGTSIGTGDAGDTGNAGGTGDTGSTDTTWYLADIRTTGDSGTITWEGLSESAYRLKEVRAPKGYQITDTGYIPAVKPNRQEGNTDPLVLTISVKNTSAFVLPKTGGTGTLPVNLAGILCLCYSGFLYKKKRAGVFTQKEKGGKGK